MKKRKILDTLISIGSFDEFIENIFLLSENKASSYVCVCNVHMLIETKKDNSFNELLNNADITTPDGMPVAKALGLKYNYTQDRVSGMDLLPAIIEECAKRKKSIYLYGSTNKVLKQITEKVNSNYPNLNLEFYSPPFRELSRQEKDEIIDKINTFKPDFVFVALGCPKQEKWISIHKGKINSCMIGLGGAFEVYAGLKTRAPKWMHENSLEWLYRLLLEPRRLFGRYFVTNSLFIWYICKEFLKINKK
ncbi:WecB/TagA/CpsF family glycosyltransferase [Flavobacteriales bacterium]|nr:WecB/TagA/CpsF family glycosyltransferase [Flavobacteriales bacterium]